jgi:hypothetical protein
MSTRNLPGVKGRPARRADNLPAICEPTVYTKCGSLDISQPHRCSRPVTGIALLFYLTQNTYLSYNSQDFYTMLTFKFRNDKHCILGF